VGNRIKEILIRTKQVKMGKEIYDNEILDRAMWNAYDIMKKDNFTFEGYSVDDRNGMINHILPYFQKIEEYEICEELNKIRRY